MPNKEPPPGGKDHGRSKKKNDIMKRVTRNCIMNLVVKNKQNIKARNERLGKAKKHKTRKEILAAMDLQDLHIERAAMAKMCFLDKVDEIDKMIEAERSRLKAERDDQDKKVIDQKMNGLQMAHRRRLAALEDTQRGQISSTKEKCIGEVEELKKKQKKEYDVLINETATRATGGVSSCVCTNKYLCHHNKSASYNTRKPGKDVIRLRQNVETYLEPC